MEKKKLTIKNWAEDDQPREKLMNKGRQVLSDAELLAILIGSGNKKMSAVELSKKILAEGANFNLDNLSKLTVNELTKFRGIGEAKAVTIVAAMELARRRRETFEEVRPVIKSSKTAFEILNVYLGDLPHEEFYVILVNRANKVIKVQQIGMGGISGTMVDVRVIFKAALDHMATGIILGHNHPSGQLKPSQADRQLTTNIKMAGKLMQIDLLDHLIIGNNAYYSFADDGTL